MSRSICYCFFYLRYISDFKWVIRNRKPKKYRQHNDQMKKDKRTNNDLQNIAQETTDRATRITLKAVGELRCSGGVNTPCSTHVRLVTNSVINFERATMYILMIVRC